MDRVKLHPTFFLINRDSCYQFCYISKMMNDDDIPWADPEIKLRYEAALGKFILAYNQIDHQLCEILEMALTRWKRPDLLSSKSFNGSLIKRLCVTNLF